MRDPLAIVRDGYDAIAERYLREREALVTAASAGLGAHPAR